MMIAPRACHTKRRSIAWSAASRSTPKSPRLTAGRTTEVTIDTPPTQITTARTCNARARVSPSIAWRSPHADEFVDAAVLRQAGIDIALGVDADAVDMAALYAREHPSLSVAHRDVRGPAILLLLGDVEIPVLAAGDVVGAAHPGPFAETFALRREDLDALVGAVGDIELALIVEGDRMRQMKLARPVPRRAP